MNLTRLKATNIEMTDAIRSAVEKELSILDPMLERWGDAATADAEVGKTTQHHRKGDVFRAVVNLQIPGKLLRAENEQEDLYMAVREVAHTLQRELNKEKELRG